jgi:uncharacterized protein YjbJ (UPF0337 family)
MAAPNVITRKRSEAMNWDRIEGNWKQLKGKIQQQWGKLTDDDLDMIGGEREMLSGRIQETYGISRDEAERQVKRWETSLRDEDVDLDDSDGRREIRLNKR